MNTNLTKAFIKNYNRIMGKNIILLGLIFVAGLVIGAGGFYLYLFQTQNSLSQDKAGEVAINFINKAIEQDNVTASLLSVSEESGVYKVHLKIEEKEYDSFISRNGKYLFSTAFNLEAPQAPQ